MIPSKMNRREALAVTGTTLAGLAVASLLPHSAASKGLELVSDGGQRPIDLWLLQTGKPVLDADLHEAVSGQIVAKSTDPSSISWRGCGPQDDPVLG